MDNIVKQIYVSKTLETYFGKNFRERWNLDPYHDVNLPAIFFGLYSDVDRMALSNHKSKSIVIWGGADMTPQSLSLVKKLVDNNVCGTWAYPGSFSNILLTNKIKHKEIYVPLKNYDKFQPNILGDKIYVYKGVLGSRPEYFMWDKIIVPLIKHFGTDKIIYTENQKIEDLKTNFYDKCFVYIKPNEKGGCTTMFELAHMGRKTLGVGHEKLPIFEGYNDMNHLIKLIEGESAYIGKYRPEITELMNKVFINNNDWLDFKYYG